MYSLKNLFRKPSKIECPRCLGKGFVDSADIKRMNRELKWLPGSCAFCSGTGKVPEDRIRKVPVDTTYLASNIPANELRKLFNGDNQALKRAKEYEKTLDNLILEIRKFYFEEKWELSRISNYYFSKYSRSLTNEFHKNEFIDFIKRIIES